MADRALPGRWAFHTLFLVLAAGYVFVSVLPVGLGRSTVPAPDLLILLTLAWLLRRPDYVPMPLIAGAFLSADILLMRPPGLWTALVVLGTESLRRRRGAGGDTFLAEWAMVSGTLLVLMALRWLACAIFAIPHATMGAAALQFVATAALYPVAVLATLHLFAVRRAAPGDRGTARPGA